MDKKGDGGIAVNRIIIYVLLLIIIVLVIYGVTTGGLNPLLERIGGKFDEVMIFIGAKDSTNLHGGTCFSQPLNKATGGDDLLTDLGFSLNEESVKYAVCSNGCFLNVSEGERYKWAGGNIYSVSGVKIERYGSNDGEVVGIDPLIGNKVLFQESAKETNLHWNLYNEFDKLIKENGLEAMYDSRASKRLTFTSDGAGLFDGVKKYAYYENDVWRIDIGNGEDVLEGAPNALSKFINGVNGGATDIDDNIYYWISEGPLTEGKYIEYGGESLGDPVREIFGKSGTGLSKGDLNNLVLQVEKIKEEIDPKGIVISEDSSELDVVVGKKIKIGEKEFTASFEKHLDFIAITLSSEREKYAAVYGPSGKVSGSLPIILARWNEENRIWLPTGKEEDYKLPEEEFKKRLKINQIKDFLKPRC